MDKKYFRSKEFIIALSIAAVVVVGGGALFGYVGITSGISVKDACDAPALPVGTQLNPGESGAINGGSLEASRTVTYVLDASDYASGAIDLCGDVGPMKIARSPDENVRLTFTVEAHGARATQAVNETRLGARFIESDGRLTIQGWQESQVQLVSFAGRRSTSVSVTLEVPATAGFDVDAGVGVGRLTVEGILVHNMTLVANVGKLTVDRVDASGDIKLTTNVGDMKLNFLSLGPSTMTIDADVGDVELSLPTRADIGYHITARGDVSHVNVDIGEDASYDRTQSNPSGRAEAKTTGYDSKPTRVRITIDTDVGDITVSPN